VTAVRRLTIPPRAANASGLTIPVSAVAAVAIVVLLSACAGKETPPIDNAFCRIYVRLPDPADAVNMKKRENKVAVLTNEQSADRECRSGDMGPR
jgi:hypothetical protein